MEKIRKIADKLFDMSQTPFTYEDVDTAMRAYVTTISQKGVDVDEALDILCTDLHAETDPEEIQFFQEFIAHFSSLRAEIHAMYSKSSASITKRIACNAAFGKTIF